MLSIYASKPSERILFSKWILVLPKSESIESSRSSMRSRAVAIISASRTAGNDSAFLQIVDDFNDKASLEYLGSS